VREPLIWRELGLSRVRVAVQGRSVVIECGVVEAGPASPGEEELPLAVYPAQSAERCPSGGIDLRLLARVLRPSLSEHRLAAVREAYGLMTGTTGALAAAELLGPMLEDAIALDRGIVALLARLLAPPLSELFERILRLPRREVPPRVAEPEVPPGAAALPEQNGAGAVLCANGAVARALAAYEERPGQLRMAIEVEGAFRDGEFLLVEAGPGTGKTFAYLAPAILLLRGDPAARVVVSTRTKQLQEQLHAVDLPFLVSQLAPGMKVALLKGRENYLCLRRWQGMLAELPGGLEQERLVELAPLVRWIFESESGDIDENGAFLSDPEARGLWGRLCDAPAHCVGPLCPLHDDCFSVAARRKARRSALVVVNHSLLLADLAAGGAILGRYTHLVVDEAHSLETAARTAFTRSLSERQLSRALDELIPSGRRSGWLRRALPTLQEAGFRDGMLRAGEARRVSAALFRSLQRKLPEERRGELRPLLDLDPRAADVVTTLEGLVMAIDRLGGHLDAEETRRELGAKLDQVSALSDVAKALGTAPPENMVHWYERDDEGLTLRETPLDVAPAFQRRLYPRVDSAVFTSATLSLGGDFSHLRRAIGLVGEAPAVRMAVVESPFSFRERMRVAVPTYFPPIGGDADAYVDTLASLLGAMGERLERKGLALFTSYQMLRAVRERVSPRIAIYAQGVDGPRSKLIDRFRAVEGGALLLGTESFWEGVDLPRAELEFLVITRLPFSVPTDPILSGVARALARQGRDPFRDLFLPQAILKLRQGIGRLIRTQEDRGVVVVTDLRLLSRSYGARFLEALPVPIDRFGQEKDLVEGMAEWLEAGGRRDVRSEGLPRYGN